MATIKSFSDLSQSKTLSKILPLESADMYYWCGEDLRIGSHKAMDLDYDIPCWSLTALLGVLPKGTNISTPKPINALSYCCWNQYDEIYADNPVDACVDMIEKLNELNLL